MRTKIHTLSYARAVTAAQRDRDVRNKRFKFVVRAARALVAAVVVIVTVAFFAIRAQREEAKAQAARADNEAQNARVAEKDAESKRDQAVAAEKVANEQRVRAQAAEEQATADRDKAIMAKQAAVAAEEAAVKAKQVAVAAEQAEAKLREQEEALRLQKEYDAYIASIGLVAAKIDENAFGYAAQLLNECQSHLRNWEWGRLMHLCRQSAQTFREEGPIDAVSYSSDGKHVVTGSWEGVADLGRGDRAAGARVEAWPLRARGGLLARRTLDCHRQQRQRKRIEIVGRRDGRAGAVA